MKITVTPTHEQIAAALANVWGCKTIDIDYNVVTAEQAEFKITTDVKGAARAEKIIKKATAEPGA